MCRLHVGCASWKPRANNGCCPSVTLTDRSKPWDDGDGSNIYSWTWYIVASCKVCVCVHASRFTQPQGRWGNVDMIEFVAARGKVGYASPCVTWSKITSLHSHTQTPELVLVLCPSLFWLQPFPWLKPFFCGYFMKIKTRLVLFCSLHSLTASTKNHQGHIFRHPFSSSHQSNNGVSSGDCK